MVILKFNLNGRQIVCNSGPIQKGDSSENLNAGRLIFCYFKGSVIPMSVIHILTIISSYEYSWTSNHIYRQSPVKSPDIKNLKVYKVSIHLL